MVVMSYTARPADAMKVFGPLINTAPSSRFMLPMQSTTALHEGNGRWWDGDGSDLLSKFSGQSKEQQSYITSDIEKDVMASARATVDSNTVSRALSSLIDSDTTTNGPGRQSEANKNLQSYNANSRGNNSLRDLASSTTNDNGNVIKNSNSGSVDQNTSSSNSINSWDTQQIAIASGATTLLLSPLIIPIIHSLVPPFLPFPSTISATGAALLGTLSYIVALGDPSDQSKLGDGVEVSGAVSRIVGRTALQSVEKSAPRIKAAARAMVDYDTTASTLEELQGDRLQLSKTVLELETENDALRKEFALWQAVDDCSNMYTLADLKEMARYEGLKGYSTEGKNALLRRLIRERILEFDLTPYYDSL